MSLSYVTVKERKPEAAGEGFKVVAVSPEGKEFKFPIVNEGPPFEFNRWLRANEIDIMSPDYGGGAHLLYRSGFHIFPKKLDAGFYLEDVIAQHLSLPKGWTYHISAVHYRDVICEGKTCFNNPDPQCMDFSLQTLVVAQMLVWRNPRPTPVRFECRCGCVMTVESHRFLRNYVTCPVCRKLVDAKRPEAA